MAHLIGEQQIDRFTVLDSEGDKILGETFTADAIYDPDGGDFDFAISELGDGLYELRYDLHKAGTYYLRVVTDALDPFQVYEFSNRTDGYEQGDTIQSYFTIRDEDGAYASGVPISLDESYDPLGSAFPPDVEDLGNGLYRASWVGTHEGIYTVRLSADLSGVGDEPQLFELEERVLPSTQDEETPFTSVVGTSLDDLVRRVALECRDYLDTTATADSDNEVWRDDLTLVARSPKMFKGSSFFVRMAASSENIGEECRVVESSEGVVSLSPPLPSPIRRRDRAYFTNLESTGFTRQTYVNQVNARISDAFPNMLRPAKWTFDTFFDLASPYLVPPPEFTHLSMVSYPAGAYDPPLDIEIPYTDVNQAGWWWDESGDRIVIQGGFGHEACGAYLTIRGFGRWGELEGDEEVTGIDSQWLVQMTAGHMILSLRDPRRQSEAAMHLNRGDGYLPKALTQLPPNVIRIR